MQTCLQRDVADSCHTAISRIENERSEFEMAWRRKEAISRIENERSEFEMAWRRTTLRK